MIKYKSIPWRWLRENRVYFHTVAVDKIEDAQRIIAAHFGIPFDEVEIIKDSEE